MRGVIVTTHNRLGFVKGAPKGLLDGCEHFEGGGGGGGMALDACQSPFTIVLSGRRIDCVSLVVGGSSKRRGI